MVKESPEPKYDFVIKLGHVARGVMRSYTEEMAKKAFQNIEGNYLGKMPHSRVGESIPMLSYDRVSSEEAERVEAEIERRLREAQK